MLWITAGVGYLFLEAIAAADFFGPRTATPITTSVISGDLWRYDSGRIIDSPLAYLLNTAFYLQGTFVVVRVVLVARAVESQNAGLVLSLAATNATGIIVVGTVHGGPIARWHRLGCIPRAR